MGLAECKHSTVSWFLGLFLGPQKTDRTQPFFRMTVGVFRTVSRAVAGFTNKQNHDIHSFLSACNCYVKIKHIGSLPGCQVTSNVHSASKINAFNAYACPQGIQGEENIEDCGYYKTWLGNCARYGIFNDNDHSQGIQTSNNSSQKLSEDRDKIIDDILRKYQHGNIKMESNIQGVQRDDTYAFPHIDSPCPQGIQGDECAQFKLWLQTCYQYGFQDCMDQYEQFVSGRKNIKQIFAEQDRAIEEAAQFWRQQRRNYSTYSAYNRRNAHSVSPFLKRSYSTSSKAEKSESVKQDKPPAPSEDSQLTQGQKLKRAVKEYGSTVIVFHVGISLTSLGFFYLLVSSGVDVVKILEFIGVGESIVQSKIATGTGTFVMAYAVHKVFAPVRIATTLTATPLIVRYLRRKGILKVPPPSN